MTKAEQYLHDVRRLPCEICVRHFGVDPDPQMSAQSAAHHPRTGAGAGRKNSDFDAIALCDKHHQNSDFALHARGRKAFERHFGVTEAELTESTRARVAAMRALEVTA